MLHIENIKLTLNNGPDLSAPMPQVTGAQQDLYSSNGFFSILKNHILSDMQRADPFAVRQDPRRYDAPASMTDSDRKPDGAAIRDRAGKEDATAADRVEEQREKAALRNQGRETANADTQKTEIKKEVDIDQQIKKADGKNAETNRIRHERQEKKEGEPGIKEMLGGLQQLIDYLKGKERPEFREAKLAAQELQDLLRTMRKHDDAGSLKKALEKLSDALQKLESRAMQGQSAEQFSSVLAGMKSERTRLKQTLDDAKQRNTAGSQDSPVNAARELLARIELALEGARNDGAGRQSSKDGQGGSDIFGLNQLKNDAAARHSDAPSAQRNAALFRENLESILQHAKVAVKDGQNASFSMRLHPRELGRVNVSLNLQDGVIIGKFMVDTLEAKNLLTQSLEQIRQQLSESGVQVGGFQVDVNDRRGELPGDRDAERTYAITPAEQAAEIEQEYAASAMARHDGHINVVI